MLSRAAPYVLLLAVVACDKKPDARERVLVELMAAYPANDTARLDQLADPAAARTDARALSCADEKLALLNCDLAALDTATKNDCDKPALTKSVEDCVCKAANQAKRFTESPTHAALKKLQISPDRCGIESVRTLAAEQSVTELPEWGKKCSGGAESGSHALARLRCEGQPTLEFLLHETSAGWRLLSLSQKTRTQLRIE